MNTLQSQRRQPTKFIASFFITIGVNIIWMILISTVVPYNTLGIGIATNALLLLEAGLFVYFLAKKEKQIAIGVVIPFVLFFLLPNIIL